MGRVVDSILGGVQGVSPATAVGVGDGHRGRSNAIGPFRAIGKPTSNKGDSCRPFPLRCLSHCPEVEGLCLQSQGLVRSVVPQHCRLSGACRLVHIRGGREIASCTDPM